MSDLVTEERKVWSFVESSTGAAIRGTTLVRGPGAAQVGEALLGLGAMTVIAQDERIDDPTANPPDDRVDTVVLLHAWPSPDQVDIAAKAATTWLRPGGWLLLADLDVDRLAGGSPLVYPSAVLYQSHRSLRDQLERRTADAIDLVTAAIRAGLDRKASTSIDRPVGLYTSRSEMQAAVEFGAWRGLENLEPEEYEQLLAALAAIDKWEWPVLDREPWTVVVGSARV